ncbi:hypothetical protein GCM10009766_22950 [Microcella frigidaquae]
MGSISPLDLASRYKVYSPGMEITLQYFTGCPNWSIAAERLATIASERPDITVLHRLVETFDDAEKLGFRGSPSILVDGVDPFADSSAPVGLACRVYSTPAGRAGAPTLEQLRMAITAQHDGVAL